MFQLSLLERARPLPRHVHLFPDETTASLISRLEQANALEPGLLKRTLQKSARPWVDTLSAWTEFDSGRLRLAMPQLSQHNVVTTCDPRLLGRPNQRITRLACHLCAYERGAVERIEIYTTHDRVVCPQHGIWVGAGTQTPRNQMSVRTCPAITAATNHHRNLITRFGRDRVCTAFYDASYINWWWHATGHHFTEFTRLHKNLLATSEPDQTENYATEAGAHYPAIVRFTAILASPFWERIAHSTHPDKFLDRVTNEVTNRWLPRSGADPLRQWMAENRTPNFTDTDTISLAVDEHQNQSSVDLLD